MMFDVTYSKSNAYVKIAFAALIDLLTCETVQPLFRRALKWAFMSARLMLRMSVIAASHAWGAVDVRSSVVNPT